MCANNSYESVILLVDQCKVHSSLPNMFTGYLPFFGIPLIFLPRYALIKSACFTGVFTFTPLYISCQKALLNSTLREQCFVVQSLTHICTQGKQGRITTKAGCFWQISIKFSAFFATLVTWLKEIVSLKLFEVRNDLPGTYTGQELFLFMFYFEHSPHIFFCELFCTCN